MTSGHCSFQDGLYRHPMSPKEYYDTLMVGLVWHKSCVTERRRKMSRINLSGIVFILVVVVAVGCSTTQKKPHPLWDKTVTLSSGEVVLDMSGEWDVQSMGYGPFSWVGKLSDIVTITQDGNTFIAIKQIGSRWVPKGAETIKGDLNKNGFNAVSAYIGTMAQDGSFEWEECKGVISAKGNMVDLDCGERIKHTLTRK
jgi:hypothetical protein